MNQNPACRDKACPVSAQTSGLRISLFDPPPKFETAGNQNHYELIKDGSLENFS
jgi:hypothetical protein